MTRCIMCGAELPPDNRWAITRWLNPRPPFCAPPTAACYRGLAAALGATPSDEEVELAVRLAVRDPRRRGRR